MTLPTITSKTLEAWAIFSFTIQRILSHSDPKARQILLGLLHLMNITQSVI